jgi:TRAP-type uncharacterized transport system substrate-binding protein
LWIVNARAPDGLVYGITHSLFHPGNRAALDGENESSALIRLDTATVDLPAPLHPGAERFFKETGHLPRPYIKTGKN